MQRGYAEYRPSRKRWPGRVRLFRSVQFNAVGWAAVAGLCLLGAAAGYGVSLLTGWPPAVSPAIGALLSLVALVVADRRHWGRIWTVYSCGDSSETTQRVATELKRLGLTVETTTHPDGRTRLLYRNRDGRRVARALRHLGIRPPRRW